MPWQVELDEPEHDASFTPGYHVKGHQIMVVGKDLLGVTPGLQYVHHVHYTSGEADHRLPVVTDDTIYLLNQPDRQGQQATSSAAGARRMSLRQKPNGGLRGEEGLANSTGDDPALEGVEGRADDVPDRSFGNALQRRAGKSLRDVRRGRQGTLERRRPGSVEDLAFHDGRLFVKCDSGTVSLFRQKAVNIPWRASRVSGGS